MKPEAEKQPSGEMIENRIMSMIERVQNGKLKYHKSPLFHKTINILARGGDPFEIIDQLIVMIEEQLKPTPQDSEQWISVHERLPEFDGPYLCFLEEPQECGTVLKFQGVVQNIMNDWSLVSDTAKVTHWMPLPSPPKQENPK